MSEKRDKALQAFTDSLLRQVAAAADMTYEEMTAQFDALKIRPVETSAKSVHTETHSGNNDEKSKA